MESFAMPSDYEARYGEGIEHRRLSVLLDDASSLIASEWQRKTGHPYAKGERPVFDDNVVAVCRGIVNRAAGSQCDFAGASQYTQTAGSYSASVTLANPSGDMYMTRSERRRLGLSGPRIGSVSPYAEPAEDQLAGGR